MQRAWAHFFFLVLISLSHMIIAQEVLLTLEQTTLIPSQCSGTFVEHLLDHTTTVPGGDEVRMFEANGGGLGINDLDNDGDLDIVLASHAGQNTILWNEGKLQFRTEHFGEGDVRAVTLVDVEGDGALDIVLSRRVNAPNYWKNQDGTFVLTDLTNVGKPLYAISWADLDNDGDLDLVGGTYDAGLLNEFGQDFLSSGRAGVFVYLQNKNSFSETRLADHAQALAIALVDLDKDGRKDILIGNDFAVPDMAWLNSAEGFREATPFKNVSHSTMSFDVADVDNNGSLELFSTDMKPYAGEDMAAWEPMMEMMMEEPMENDPQVMANVFQVLKDDDFAEQALVQGIDATGWSWSAKFGDLNQDGLVDLYVVNGMMESTTFAHLPHHELVEENQAFKNEAGKFVVMPEWGLASISSGRGMSMADLDNDGDLDIVVNNVRTPAQLFENQLCEGSSLQVDLHWSDGKNIKALGAVLTLETDRGTFQRDVRALSGYLSGDTTRVHFGFPKDTVLQSLSIRWPDGATSRLEDLQANMLYTVLR